MKLLPLGLVILLLTATSLAQTYPHDFERDKPGTREISGQLLDPAGEPLPNSTVTLTNPTIASPEAGDSPSRRERPATATTDPSGRFSFTRLYRGKSDLVAETPTARAWLRDVDTNAKNVTLRLEPKTDPVHWQGALTHSDGSAAAGVHVLLMENAESRDVLKDVITDNHGKYSLDFEPRGRTIHAYGQWQLHLIAQAADGQLAWRTVYPLNASDLNLQFHPATDLSGRITDEKDAPIAGAALRPYGVWDKSGNQLLFPLDAMASVGKTDADGYYSVKIPGDCRVFLQTSHPDYQSAVLDHNPPFPDSEKPLKLKRGIIFEGTVTLDGKPVENARVSLGYPADPVRTITTDKSGHYIFTGVGISDSGRSVSQQEISAEAGSTDDSPMPRLTVRPTGQSDKAPRYQAVAYYDQAFKAGDRITLDLKLQPSLAVRYAQWKADPGKRAASDCTILMLENPEPISSSQPSNTRLVAQDAAGNERWRYEHLNMYISFAAHPLACDPKTGAIWIAENSAKRLLKLSRDGKLEWAKDNVKAYSLALDPKTGNAWVLTSEGTIYGSGLVVFAPGGAEVLHSTDIKGNDIAYSPKEDCFWVCAKTLEKVDREAKVIAKSETTFPWIARSMAINDKDGSVWIAEGRHPNVLESRGQIWIFEPDARLRKKFTHDLDYLCLALDTQRNTAWLAGRTSLQKVDIDGKILDTAPAPYCTSIAIEPDTGQVWCAGSLGARYYLDPDAKYLIGEADSTTRRSFCIVPKE